MKHHLRERLKEHLMNRKMDAWAAAKAADLSTGEARLALDAKAQGEVVLLREAYDRAQAAAEKYLSMAETLGQLLDVAIAPTKVSV